MTYRLYSKRYLPHQKSATISGVTQTLRLTIRVNSKPVCVAGIDATDQGVLDARVSLVTKTPNGDTCDLFVSSKQITGGDLTFGL